MTSYSIDKLSYLEVELKLHNNRIGITIAQLTIYLSRKLDKKKGELENGRIKVYSFYFAIIQ